MSNYLFLKQGSEMEFYMNNLICSVRVRKLLSISITRGYSFLRRKILEHFSAEYLR